MPSKVWRSWPKRPLRRVWCRTIPIHFLEEGLFTTLTNVNFDPGGLTDWVHKTVDRREKLKTALAAKQPGVTFPEGPATFVAGYTSAAVAAARPEHDVNTEASS